MGGSLARYDATLPVLDGKTLALVGVAGILIAAAVAVRILPAPRVISAEEVKQEGPRIVEPMQLLGRGAALRAAELDEWIAEERRPIFRAARGQVFSIRGCPEAVAWLDGVEGQRVERLLGELRHGTREEALAALALVFQLARSTEWDPGVLASIPEANAARLAGLAGDWLRAWGERGARDPLLAEPARAAALLYGRLMYTAQHSRVIGTNTAAYERGLKTLSELVGLDSGRRTALGESLQSRHPEAMRKLVLDSDRLRGFDAEARTAFPDLDGECGG